jgi:hypothetical protein
LNKFTLAIVDHDFQTDALRFGRAVTVPPISFAGGWTMRSLLALTLIVPLGAGCTPYIPERLDFGTSALAPKGDIPTEYAGFNNYDPGLNAELANQICATSYQPGQVTTADAVPGQLVTATGTCAPHTVLLGP